MNDYRKMWADLGMDLDRHDQLLAAIPVLYGDTYLSQRNRPSGMQYFDFVMSEIHGLRIQELVEHRKRGGIVIGTYCVFVPEDLIIAANGVCVGLCAGAQFSVPDGEAILPRNTCPLIKSSLGFAVNGTCPYLKASNFVVGETTCDGKKEMFEIFGDVHPIYVMEVPQKKTAAGRALFLDELYGLKKRLEQESGVEIAADRLAEATAVVEGKYRAMQRLHAARAANPAPVSGLDALLVNQIAFFDDPRRFTEKTEDLAAELEQRTAANEGVASADAPRLLMSGSPMALPNWKVHALVERSGAVVVGEESCVGSRYYGSLSQGRGKSLEEQMSAIADRHLNVHCACFTPNNERLDDIVALARATNAQGVIHYNLQFCQTYANEAVKVERHLAKHGLPLLRLETDYGEEDTGQLQTRIEAFLETLRV
jgi:benzoyl-CoA reductase/2-hydroxyglutaryl-CoA dehydratase subunit BcrC/BadD/HgdB